MNLSQFNNSGDFSGNYEDREDLIRVRNGLSRAESVYFTGGKISKEDFNIIKVIGRGGFGKVYMVKKHTNAKVYAMKVLSKD